MGVCPLSRVPPSSFEGVERQPYESGWHSVTGLTPALPHSVSQWRGWAHWGVGGTTPGCDSQARQRDGVYLQVSEHKMAWSGEQVWEWRAHGSLERGGPHPRGRPAPERGRTSPERGWGLALERGGPHPRGRPALERGGTSPEGATVPRARWSFASTVLRPSSEAEFRPRCLGQLFCGPLGPPGS
jgi:hypothetical protein